MLTCPGLNRGFKQSRQLQTLPTVSYTKPCCGVSSELLHCRKRAQRRLERSRKSGGGTSYASFPSHLLSLVAAMRSPASSNGK